MTAEICSFNTQRLRFKSMFGECTQNVLNTWARESLYTGVLVSEFAIRTNFNRTSDTKTPWSDTEVSRYPYIGIKVAKDKKVQRVFWRSEYGELKNLFKTSVASLEAEKKPFYCFRQLFYPRGLGIRTKRQKIRIPRPRFVRIPVLPLFSIRAQLLKQTSEINQLKDSSYKTVFSSFKNNSQEYLFLFKLYKQFKDVVFLI